MNERKDGGPAFPRPIGSTGAAGQFNPSQEGMSLRDFFAAAAMQGMCGQFVTEEGNAIVDRLAAHYKTTPACAVAKMAGEFSDAMIAERAKGKP
jgi:hypothetical protein